MLSVVPNLVAMIVETLGTRLGFVKQDTRDDSTGVGDFHITLSPPWWWTKKKISHYITAFVRRPAIAHYIIAGVHQWDPHLPYLA